MTTAAARPALGALQGTHIRLQRRLAVWTLRAELNGGAVVFEHACHHLNVCVHP
jgi:hypothetical protein